MGINTHIATHQHAFEKHASSHPLLTKIRQGGFDRHGLVYKSPLHKLVWWWTFENIFALLRLRAEDRVLNIGIGFGSDEKVINTRLPGISLHGIDISASKIIGSLMNSTPAAIAVAAAEELPLPNNMFTRIVSREVVEHVLNPDLFLSEIRRVAAPGAIAVITTPNGDSLAFMHLLNRLGLHSNQGPKDEHMTCNQLEYLFDSHGFEIRERFFDCAGYFWLSWLFRTPLGLLAPVLAKATRSLEGSDLLSRLMCDQVKYVLMCKNAGQESICHEERIKTWVCPKCKGLLSEASTNLKCESCHAIYNLIDGKTPVFLEDPAHPSAANKIRETKGLKRLLVLFSSVTHSFVYTPVLISAAAIALLLRLFGRSSKPLCD